LVSVAAVGGFGNADFSIKQSDIKDYYIVPKFKERHIDFMIEISGSSMQPKYNSGDVVACTLIKESRFIQWNKAHVIATTEQGILVKRLRKGLTRDCLLAISDNKDYEPFEIPVNEIIGLAIVVGVVRLE
jgi:phage repressor protein C with HTH and peptisase S24 domain